MAYVIASAIILIYTVALSVLSFEKGAQNANITTMGDSLWWAMVTITTIGYGDFYPVTVLGRWAAAALMVGGFVVLSMVTAAVSSWLVESVAAATDARKEAGEAAKSEELARLTAQIERLQDQLAPGPMEPGSGQTRNTNRARNQTSEVRARPSRAVRRQRVDDSALRGHNRSVTAVEIRDHAAILMSTEPRRLCALSRDWRRALSAGGGS